VSNRRRHVLWVGLGLIIVSSQACIFKDDNGPVGDKFRRVAGTVADSSTSVPIPDVTVVYADSVTLIPTAFSRTSTNVSGQYSIRVGGVPVGIPAVGYLSFSKEGYRGFTVPVRTVFPEPEIESRAYDVILAVVSP
jgi:hypothetical protein